jgi:TPP-dependent pyruvate/acetoin dehydrogenase alpha subunit
MFIKLIQGRFSFYMTSNGEEATVIGSAAALDPKDEARSANCVVCLHSLHH